jgi:hypothetical protein
MPQGFIREANSDIMKAKIDLEKANSGKMNIFPASLS